MLVCVIGTSTLTFGLSSVVPQAYSALAKSLATILSLSTQPPPLIYSKSYASFASQYQGPQALDSILQYPMYGALVDAFAIPGPQNMSAMTDMIAQSKAKFKVSTLLRYIGRIVNSFIFISGPWSSGKFPGEPRSSSLGKHLG